MLIQCLNIKRTETTKGIENPKLKGHLQKLVAMKSIGLTRTVWDLSSNACLLITYRMF